MEEKQMVVWASFPLLIILISVGLLFFWMVHHHLWKPLMGILLVVAGLFFFSLFAYHSAERDEAIVHEADFRSAEARRPMTSRTAEASLDKPDGAELHIGAEAPPVEPSDSGKPAWVGQPPHTDDNGAYVVSASSGLYQSEPDCEVALAAAIDTEIRAYAEKLDSDAANEPLTIVPAMRESLIRQRHTETADLSVGKMLQLDAQLAFTKDIQANLIKQIKQFVINQRLKYTAAGGGAVLLVLGLAYSILRRNPRTREAAKPAAV
jgi:hypothetical protein